MHTDFTSRHCQLSKMHVFRQLYRGSGLMNQRVSSGKTIMIQNKPLRRRQRLLERNPSQSPICSSSLWPVASLAARRATWHWPGSSRFAPPEPQGLIVDFSHKIGKRSTIRRCDLPKALLCVGLCEFLALSKVLFQSSYKTWRNRAIGAW
jgi:hypothetical protein